MIPDTYHDDEDESDAPDRAGRRRGKRDRSYYSLYREPTGPQHEPWMTDDQWENMPRRLPGECLASWLARRHAYVEDLRDMRAVAAAEKPPAAAAKPAQPAPGKPVASPAFAAAAASARQSPPPPPLSPPSRPLLRRQERLCQLFVVYGNAADAAYKAGYSVATSANQGYRLLKRSQIQARIAELHRGLAAAFGLDARVLLGKLETVYRQAIEHKDLSAAARVVELQARIAGLAASRTRPTAPIHDDR